MAEESINLQITEEKSESNGYSSSGEASMVKLSLPGNVSGMLPENHSTSSDSCPDAYNPRRNSTGKPSPKTSNEKIVPHHLRASTGSCHDFCKYGHKHTFEEKEIRPWRKRIIKAQTSKQNPARTVPSGEKKKGTVLKQMTSPHRTQNPAVTASLGELKKAKVIKEMVLPHRTKNPSVTAPLDESKKATVLKKMTSPDRTQNPVVTAPLDERKRAAVLNQMTSPDRTQNRAVTATPVERKKATVHKQMASPDREQSPAMAVALREKKKAASVVNQLTSPDKVSVSLNHKAASVSLKHKAASVSFKHKASPAAMKWGDHPGTIKQEVMLPSKKVEASSKDSSFHKNSKIEKRMNKFSSENSSAVRAPLMKQLSSSHSLASVKKTEKAAKVTKSVKSESSPSVMQLGALPKSSLSSHTSDGLSVRGKRRDNIITSKNMGVTKASANKVLELSIASSAPSITRNVALNGKKSKSLKPVSLLEDQNSIQKSEMEKPENENVPEKTLHVIVTETESNLSESTPDNKVIPPPISQSFPSPTLSSSQSPSLSSQEDGETEEEVEEDIVNEEVVEEIVNEEEVLEEIESEEEVLEENDDDDGSDEEEEVEEDQDDHTYEEEVDEVLSDEEGMANDNDIKAMVGNQRKTLRKGSVISESKDTAPVKIKFRRGRVVDLQSESHGPRRLRFRQGRVIDENHHRMSETRRRNFKKKGADGDGSVPNPSDEKVVLRHQDLQGKKDAQGLFNNVIEETASKLVESRKSKVKALVGAFETVISLQDSKPSTQTVS